MTGTPTGRNRGSRAAMSTRIIPTLESAMGGEKALTRRPIRSTVLGRTRRRSGSAVVDFSHRKTEVTFEKNVFARLPNKLIGVKSLRQICVGN